MKHTIFYSWQSDRPPSSCRHFISGALKAALKKISKGDVVYQFDQATERVSGTPDIAQTLFEKIEVASVAVFDVTPVSDGDGRQLPNPNVLIELGFAAKAIGWDRIILVMNKEFGGDPEGLPFDIRGRRFPVVYDGSTSGKKKALQDALSEFIPMAVAQLDVAVASALKKQNSASMATLLALMEKDNFAHNNEDNGINRLLDTDVLALGYDPATGKYSYHWTNLGQRLIAWCQDTSGKS